MIEIEIYLDRDIDTDISVFILEELIIVSENKGQKNRDKADDIFYSNESVS